MKKSCFQCGKKGSNMYGYTICDSCKSELRLFTDKTIKKYVSDNPSFDKEIAERLVILDKDYIRKKIKLLHVQERRKHI